MAVYDAIFGALLVAAIWFAIQIAKGLAPALSAKLAARIERRALAWLRLWQTGRLKATVRVRGRFAFSMVPKERSETVDRILKSAGYEGRPSSGYTAEYRDPTGFRVSETVSIVREYSNLGKEAYPTESELPIVGLTVDLAVDGRVRDLDEILDIIKSRVDLLRDRFTAELEIAVELPRSEVAVMLPATVTFPKLGFEEARRVTYEVEGREILSCSVEPSNRRVVAQLDGFRTHPMTVQYLRRAVAEALATTT